MRATVSYVALARLIAPRLATAVCIAVASGVASAVWLGCGGGGGGGGGGGALNGPVSASSSTVKASRTSNVFASGSDATTITVHALDSNGNAVSGLKVTLSASGTGAILIQPVSVTDSNGIATGKVASTAVGAVTVTATAGGSALSQTATVNFQATPTPLAALTVSNLPSPIQGQAYNIQLPVLGGRPPYTFTLTSGLASGITLSSNGLISGTTNQTGSFELVYKITDSAGATATASYSGGSIGTGGGSIQYVVLTPSFSSAFDLNATFDLQPFIEGGSPPYTVNYSNLPAGVTLADTNTGRLTGLMTASGSFSGTVTVTDSTGNTITATLSGSVSAPTVTGGGGGGGGGGALFDGTYSGTFSGQATCTSGGVTASQPVNAPFSVAVVNNQVQGATSGGAINDTGAGISSFVTWTIGTGIGTVTFTGTFRTGTALGKTASGTWTLTNPPQGCTEGGTWQSSTQ